MCIRDRRTGHAVAQRREEGGAIDVEAHEEEVQGVDAEGVAGQCQQLGVVAHEDAGYIGDDQHGEGGHNDGDDADEAEALRVKVVQLGVVAGAVVVADDGGAAHRIAHEDGHKQERRIHRCV